MSEDLRVPPPAPRCLTIDVEDYYHAEAARAAYFQDRWGQFPARVEPNTYKLLELLDRHQVRATFFMLGHVVKRRTTLARQIQDAGHEVACHGTMHDRLARLGPNRFRADVDYCRKLLEDQTGRPVLGYRAPSFSLGADTPWAVEVLLELGFTYDASVFPVWHPYYGSPRAPLTPFELRGTPHGPGILEVPPLVWRGFGRRVGVAGGGYFRLLPLTFMKRGLVQARRVGRPAVLYFHPWEFDAQTPRAKLPLTNRIRLYHGLGRATRRLEHLLRWAGRRGAGWSTIAAALPTLRPAAEAQPPFALCDSEPDADDAAPPPIPLPAAAPAAPAARQRVAHRA